MIIMRDSTNPEKIPTNTPVVAGYADGFYEWDQTDWDRFPNAVKLTIATKATTEADILDVENGDATPSEAVEWCSSFHRPHRERPTIYCNRSTWPTLQSLLTGHVVDYWISTLDGTESVDGAVAVQYKDVVDYDESVVQDPSWILGAINLMDLNTARSFIWIYRLMLFGPKALSEGQAPIDSYATRMVNGENPESVLNSLLDDAQKDGRLNPFFKVS